MFKIFIRSVMAGMAISMGGVIYLSTENPVIGAFLFSIGIFTIYTFSFYLFTGKVCYILTEKPSYMATIVQVYIGNFIGAAALGYLLRQTKLVRLVEHATEITDGKLSDTPFSTFIMACMCGIMMSVAVIGFQTIKDSVGKHIALILPIMVFILSGYEHSIADMFYFSMADAWGGKSLPIHTYYFSGKYGRWMPDTLVSSNDPYPYKRYGKPCMTQGFLLIYILKPDIYYQTCSYQKC